MKTTDDQDNKPIYTTVSFSLKHYYPVLCFESLENPEKFQTIFGVKKQMELGPIPFVSRDTAVVYAKNWAEELGIPYIDKVYRFRHLVNPLDKE